MKKIFIVLVCSMFLMCFNAEVNAEEIQGLSEKIDGLIIEKNFTEEQFKEMDKQYIDGFDKWFWNEYLTQTKMLGKMNTDSDEEEYEYCLNRDRPDYSCGVLITQLKSKKYKQQYAQNSVFDYLFNDLQQYWITAHNSGYGIAVAFSKTGERIYDYEQATITQEMMDFLKDKSRLKNMLLQKNENKVDDIKIFCFNRLWTLMYIKCQDREYGVVLFYLNGSDISLKPKFDLYKLYDMSDIISLNEEQNREELGEYYISPSLKPIYTAEAESLQSEGLLRGNEKGLDLLKPLTRIEATAMLVRAMGYEDIPTSGTSYFADIQSDNWGAKYANIAKDKGIAAGVGDGKFAPDEMITASQFATLILRNMGENPDWQTAINTFVERGLITSEQAEKMDLFTRGDMAKIIYEAKQRSMF